MPHQSGWAHVTIGREPPAKAGRFRVAGRPALRAGGAGQFCDRSLKPVDWHDGPAELCPQFVADVSPVAVIGDQAFAVGERFDLPPVDMAGGRLCRGFQDQGHAARLARGAWAPLARGRRILPSRHPCQLATSAQDGPTRPGASCNGWRRRIVDADRMAPTRENPAPTHIAALNPVTKVPGER